MAQTPSIVILSRRLVYYISILSLRPMYAITNTDVSRILRISTPRVIGKYIYKINKANKDKPIQNKQHTYMPLKTFSIHATSMGIIGFV